MKEWVILRRGLLAAGPFRYKFAALIVRVVVWGRVYEIWGRWPDSSTPTDY